MAGFDYVIVGAGAAGAVLANRLTEDPEVRVALIEQGTDRNSQRAIVRIPLAMVTFMAPSLAWLGGPKFMQWLKTEPEPGLNGRRIALPRGKGTGGSTLVNGQIWIRGQREDFDGWRDLGNPGWGYDDLLPYFRRSERLVTLAEPDADRHLPAAAERAADRPAPELHGGDGPVTLAPMRSVTPLARLFHEAAARAGHRFNGDFNGPRQDGYGFYTFTQKRGERVTAESAYIDPVRDRPNLAILPERRVTRVLTRGRRAVGVAWRSRDGAEGETHGREVILSAGSFASPQLLMLSGIGDAAHLAEFGIEVVHHLPGVGRNLQDHLDVTLEYKAKTRAPYGGSWRALPRNALHLLDWLTRRRGLFSSTTAEGGAFLSTRGSGRPDIQLFFCTAMANTQNARGFGTHGFLMHVCELRPESRGSVRLKSRDPAEPPEVRYNFFQGGSGPEVLREGVRIARDIIGQPPFAPHTERELAPGPDVTDDAAIEDFVRDSVGTLFHPVGTCAIGTGADAVVDPGSFRVHGVEGLRVVDASLMPTVVSGNTLAATYCIAEKASDAIRGRTA
ncbi:Glucose-methanol-choline oxidoreductase:FAD dependent oxidoreductase:GMC oxidoreductase [Oceanicola granulosus HTCC2516]|uniref:Glucose-methanol-choline oxidoreductase:FAD dependent oxidoreductase:GMC oxidoreductase n=1 Tax=Oceanicola granulosus (strain ATCC BAA-861 / DSM 15982 / KCTC 12143 / HTCC2516) TaxID=314256 RepID=Q2CGA9_OCEGH|nr:GMC family oxidoreductase N-terminal domain-containing protein [Oceanicola granulosus]EAR51809.1 Glucose-methanol-choline oxidoreductase:FAD dependent oxidoreductase:GMC oxidoreductase [Oceanicola granulosus HTCC2516]